MIRQFIFLIVLVLLFCSMPETVHSQQMKALIIDGENNHGIWPKTTMMMKDYLEQTGLFEVDIQRTKFTWQGPHHNVEDRPITDLITEFPLEGHESEVVDEPQPDPAFNPDFSSYDLVVSNFGWKASLWPGSVQKNFENYVDNGGGLVIVHAANNSFGNWDAYNRMIGIGGWGGRTEEDGRHVWIDDGGSPLSDDHPKMCGSHGPQMEYMINTQAKDHPIMSGLPERWLHAKDELYDRLCGPAEEMTILATGYSDVEKNGPPWNKEVSGSGRHEPLLMAINFGRGRVFHTALGHMDYSMECVGFIVTFQRGSEWAATGQVTQSIPQDFPDDEMVSTRNWKN